MKHRSAIRKYHAPIWNEPVITQMGSDGRRGLIFRESSQSYFDGIGSAQQLLPEGMYREDKPSLPELSEHEVQAGGTTRRCRLRPGLSRPLRRPVQRGRTGPGDGRRLQAQMHRSTGKGRR